MSNNNDKSRLDPAGTAKKQKANHQISQQIGQMCLNLYNILGPGQTLEFIVPKNKIVVPGQPRDGGKLIITKPAINIQITQQKPGEN
jgi:hypothetical protein